MNDLRINGRRLAALLGCALALAGPRVVRAQGNQIYLGTADYVNRTATNGYITSVTTNGTTVVTNGAAVFFSGSIGPNASAPNDGTNYLIASGFGQPVQTLILRGPDFHLGDSITNQAFVWCSDSNKVFIVNGTQVFAGDAGFVQIVWTVGGPTNTYLISGLAAAGTPQVSMYLTDTNGIPTGAPAVRVLNGVSLVPHFNSTILASNLVLVSNAWRANTNVGSIVLEVRTNGGFAGVEVLQVRPPNADYEPSVGVGAFLAPVQTHAGHIAPFVAAGLSSTGPSNTYYAVQYQGYANDLHNGDVLATQPTAEPGQLVVFWYQYGQLDGMAWPNEMDDYSANWPADFGQVARKIYWTWQPNGTGLGQMGPPVVLSNLIVGITVIIDFGAEVPPIETDPYSGILTNTIELDVTLNELHARIASGRVLLHYINTEDQNNSFLGVEYVSVVPYSADVVDDWTVPGSLANWYVGDQLLAATNEPDMTSFPLVRKGLQPNNGGYVYQHDDNTSPMNGDVFAIEPTVGNDNVEIFWERTNFLGIVWPYEMHQYTARWPTNLPGKYQLYARGSSGNSGESVSLPFALNPALMPYMAPAGHANLSGNTFSSSQPTSPGGSAWSLLKYAPSNNVAFQVVRSVAHNDPAFFNLSLNPWSIGSEIVDSVNPAASRFGYIYAPPPPGNPHDWDRYDYDTYGGTNTPTGQIFAVNRGKLEVWWSTSDTNGTPWPTIVLLYTNWWPANAPNIVIASQNGTPLFTNGQAYAYYQNDPTQPGFNPNEEHVWPPAGTRFYPLRNDLNQTNNDASYTSAPYVLIKSPSLLNPNLWQYNVFGVLAEGTDWSGTNYTFRYPALAGLEIVEPTPLDSLDSPVAPGTKAVSGPWWQGLNTNFFFAKAAGNDGHSTTNLVMQYYYRSQAGFYFPDDYLTNQFVTNLFAPLGIEPTNTPPASTPFPWLDLYAKTPGTPQDVTFVVSWPASPPLLSFAETLFAEKPAIGGGYLPAIAGNGTNVAVIYEQAMATGGVHSVQLILPTNAVSVALNGLPTDIQAITNLNDTVIFPGLPPDLRQQVWWDGNLNKLVFAGVWVTANLHAVAEPLGYLLLNVLTPRDKAELLALSTNSTPADSDFRNAINALASSAGQVMLPGATNATQYDSLALTAGNAQGGGYVTLAFNNSPTELPTLQIIQVGCPGYLGDVEYIPNPNIFGVTQTLQYSGDFGGNAANYNFEWQRTLPSTTGGPDTNNWADVAVGPGMVNFTIQGSGPDILVDHFFRCRYQPLTNTLCGSGWSEWSDGMTLAPGWIDNILGTLNPFDVQFNSYGGNPVDIVINMLTLAGPRWIGNVPLNAQASNLGLIQVYETVLKTAEQMSIDNPTYNASDPVLAYNVNSALMHAAGCLADLYMLFGNEAYAESVDPTVSFGDQTTTYATTASSIFCFEGDPNALTLLYQELALLRGRDDSFLPPVDTYPVYNRLYWNNDPAGNQDGVVAYVNTYCGGNPTNGPIYYPQGHGDAWGHYLTALTEYYGLFRSPNFTMIPALDVEEVNVDGVTKDEGLMHERKFATAAAARAQTGLDIINLTYRSRYQENAANEWGGYYDSNTNRAWGVSEWGMKAGLAAYFDWVTANAILPHQDTNAADIGTIAQVDRTTVTELGQIASTAGDIQSQLDNADQGLNPLGVSKDIIPMDVDPTQVSQGVSQFTQVYNKAVAAMNNLLAVFGYAEASTAALRQQADTVQQFQNTVANQEASYNNQLITIFGTPYPQDPNYPPGYNGPDINGLDFNYIDYQPITGVAPPTTGSVTQSFYTSSTLPNGGVVLTTNAVVLTLADDGLQFVKPAAWTQPRVSPGTIQQALGNLLQAHQKFNTALLQYNNLIIQIQDQSDLLESQYGVNAGQINILNKGLGTQTTLDQQIYQDQQNVLNYNAAAGQASAVGNAMATMLPLSVGFSFDATAPIRGAIQLAAAETSLALGSQANQASLAELQAQQDAQLSQAANNITVTLNQQVQGITNQIIQLQQLVQQEPVQRSQLDNLQEAITEAAENYRSTLGQGVRVLGQQALFLAQTAQQVQEYRYKDMAFRIFRNDALSKFDAQFDMAALYAYLAAKAYDFETCFLPGAQGSLADNFMQQIIQTRALGLMANGLPLQGEGDGDPGLADALYSLSVSYNDLSGRLGINNQEHDTERFSLRSELFRVQTNQNSTVAGQLWRQILTQAVVPDMFALPEFQRYCSPPNGATSPCPAIVLFFGTTIKADENFFGWPLGGGDSYFNPSAYATKIWATGIWFDNYDTTHLANTPYVYLVPVGDDVFYAAGQDTGGMTRQFTVLDEALPPPPTSLSGDLSTNNPAWIPIDGMSEPLDTLRQFDEFQAYPDSGQWTITQATSSTRLVCRSVWNTRWMLIIPSVSVGSAPNILQTFINGALGDGNGVSDIKLLFQSYAYTGH
jgi:hypothetical protein